jgi:hypothetical protein
VLRIGDRVRITVQLVDVANDRSLWAKSYERSLTDIVALQSEVAHAIASEIRIQVTPEERARLRSKGTDNPAAHVAYLQGSFLWNRFTGGSVKEAILRYEEALAIDPNCNGPRSFPRSFQIHSGLDSQILHPQSGGIGYSVVYAQQYPKDPEAIPSWPMISERSSPSREASPRLAARP